MKKFFATMLTEGADLRRQAPTSISFVNRGLWLPLLFIGVWPLRLRAAEEIPDLRPAGGTLAPTFWELHGWTVAAVLALVLAAVALILGWLRRPKRVEAIPPEVVARRALEALRGREENFALVSEAARLLRQYAIAVFFLPPGELTTEELLAGVRAHALATPELADALGDFLRECDARRFAPVPPAAQSAVVARALEFLDQMELLRRRLSVPPLLPPPLPPTPTPAATSAPA